MYRIYAKVNDVYLSKWGTLSPQHGYILLNEDDLKQLLTLAPSDNLKIYSEDGDTFYNVVDGELEAGTDPDIETDTLIGNEPAENTEADAESVPESEPTEPLRLPPPDTEAAPTDNPTPPAETPELENVEHKLVLPEQTVTAIEHKDDASVGDKLALAEERANTQNEGNA